MILLTGGNGFVGKHISEYLRKNTEKGISHNRKNWGDLSNIDDVKRIFDHFKEVDTIIHFAANAKPKLDDDPSSMIDDNIKATMNLAEYCKEGTRIIFASSIVVYGNSEYVCPIEDDPCSPISIYASTKLCSEHILNYYASTGKINVVHMRMPAIVGSGLTHGALKDIIRKVQENEILELFGNYPGSDKSYLHITDLIKALDAILADSSVKGPINICSDDSITICELAGVVMEELNIYKYIQWLGESSTWVGDNLLLRANNVLAKLKLKWEPMSSEDAIRQTVRDIILEKT